MNSRVTELLPAILGGALLACTFPFAAGGGWLNQSTLFVGGGWICLALLAHTLHPQQAKRNFLKGYLFGCTAFTIILYWVTHSMIYYGNLALWQSVFVLLLLVAYLSLYTGCWACLYHRYGSGWQRVLLASATWVLLEYIRGYVLTGFPWCNLGYSQGNSLRLSQSADLFGIYGVSFWVAVLNFLLYELWRSWHNGNPLRTRRYAISAALLVASLLTYGQWRLISLQSPQKPESEKTIKLSLIQGNIPQGEKWQTQARSRILEIYREFSQQLLANDDLIIWPEASFPYSLDYQTHQIPGLKFSTEPAENKTILIGAPTYIPSTRDIMNSMFMINANGMVKSRYDKIRLVLFGEFVPLADFLPIKKLTQAIGNFTAGTQSQVFSIDHLPKPIRIGPLICYEIIYPDLARAYAQKGVDVLVNITNDAWFGSTSGPYQHLALARFRAIENRLPIARAANTGISAVIEATGALMQTLPLNRRATLSYTLALHPQRSPYSRWGDWPLLAGLLLILLVVP